MLTASVDWFARMPSASYRLPGPSAVLMVTFFMALTLLAATILAGWRRIGAAAFLSLLALALLVALHPFPPRLNHGRLEVTVLDIGQGDSIFVGFPDGRTMLVDGGGLPGSTFVRGMRAGIDVGEDVVSPYLWSRGLKRLDVVALTHAHEDHIGGLFAVLRNFRVGELWVGHDVDSAAYRSLLVEARARGVRVVHRVQGESFDWAGVRIQVLWPLNDDPVRSATNDDSLVLRLQDGSERLLLAGDIERPVERNLTAGADSSSLSADFSQGAPVTEAAHHPPSLSWKPCAPVFSHFRRRSQTLSATQDTRRDDRISSSARSSTAPTATDRHRPLSTVTTSPSTPSTLRPGRRKTPRRKTLLRSPQHNPPFQ